MIIFSLLDTPAFGGAEQYMYSQLSYLQTKGFSIVLATNNETVKHEILSRMTEEQKKSFTIIHAPYRLDAIGNWKGLVKFFLGLPYAMWWCYTTLRNLKKGASQVICLWPGFSDRLVFSPIAKQLALPLLWIEIGPLEPTFRKNYSFPKYLYRFFERYPDHVITTSEFTKKSILKHTHFTSGKITLVYPGTKIYTKTQVAEYKRKGSKWRKNNHVGQEKLFIVIARLAGENEVAMVIKAFAEYQKLNKNASSRLLLVGDGPIRNQLESLVDELGITNMVQFLGFVSEEMKRVLLAASDCFIFPRAWELDGFGMTTIEALSLGIPVLTSDFGPQVEIVADGKEGFRYSPHDLHDLAKFMNKIASLDKKMLEQMGERGLRRVEHFSERRSHDALYDVIRSVRI
jgi:glycosyltransferase involved in cell wall biosynthesis